MPCASDTFCSDLAFVLSHLQVLVFPVNRGEELITCLLAAAAPGAICEEVTLISPSSL